MRTLRRICVALIPVAMQACTFYSTDRTFFEPNTEDGKPTKSSSCGFRLSDALERQLPEALISVAPLYDHEHKRPLMISVLVRTTDRAVHVNPQAIELQTEVGRIYQPTDWRRQAYGLMPNHRHWNEFVTLTYTLDAAELRDITIAFRRDAVAVKGKPLEISPFRFTKVTKPDSYYSSINC
jgi:hypothetical protein